MFKHTLAAALLLLQAVCPALAVDPNTLYVPAPYIVGDPTPNYFPDWNNPQGKERVDCALKAGEPTEVGLYFGQSNTTATANGLHYPTNRTGVQNFNISDGGCYIAKPGGPIDPLLGATGYPPGLSIPYPTGSWIGILADMRISAGKATREIMVPIGVGGSYIRDWEPGGANNIRFGVAARRLAAAGLTPTWVLIGQGESDLYTPGPDYQASLQNTINSIHSYWPNVDIYVAQETYIAGYTSAAVAAAQLAVVNPAAHVHQGPNGDLLGSAYRYDNIHFSYSPGCTTWAARWNAVLP
jgi:hypothetical protein